MVPLWQCAKRRLLSVSCVQLARQLCDGGLPASVSMFWPLTLLTMHATTNLPSNACSPEHSLLKPPGDGDLLCKIPCTGRDAVMSTLAYSVDHRGQEMLMLPRA